MIGIFPGPEAIVRLVGTVLAEHHDEWVLARRSSSGGFLATVTLPQVALEATDSEAAEGEEVMPVPVAAAG